MIKFTKNDLGLYFALALAGAGVGILVGSVVSSKLRARRIREEADEIVDEPEIQLDSDFGQEATPVYEVGPGEDWDDEEDEWADTDDVEAVVDMKSPEVLAFIEQYNPTQIQLAAIEIGLKTIDEIIEMMAESDAMLRDADERSSRYHKKYSPATRNIFEEADKERQRMIDSGELELKLERPLETLNEILQERGGLDPVSLIPEDMIDGRYLVLHISDDEAKELGVTQEFTYFPNLAGRGEPTWAFISGKNYPQQLRAGSFSNYVSRAAWAEIEPAIMLGERVYLEDTSKSTTDGPCLYYIHLDDEDDDGNPIRQNS